MVKKRNIYTHSIDLKVVNIRNTPNNDFLAKVEALDYRGYEVESIADGRKIVITKPGGKFSFGRIKKEDFMVFIYSPNDNSLWLISHKDILNDLKKKGGSDSKATIAIIETLEKVFRGIEPEDIIEEIRELQNPVGELPEVLVKAYKWIWVQEDINYPTGKGRALSFEPIRSYKTELEFI